MTLQEIKDQITNERHWPSFDNLQDKFQLQLWPEVCRRAQLECARETLKEASKNATVSFKLMPDLRAADRESIKIDEQSILDEANIKLIQ